MTSIRNSIKGIAHIAIVSIVVLLMINQHAVSAQSYCQVKSDSPSVYPTVGQNFVLSMDNFFEGYNLTYQVPQGNPHIAVDQTAVLNGQAATNWTAVVGYDIWKNTDGSSTHTALVENNNLLELYFGLSQGPDFPPFWQANYSIQFPIQTCLGVVLVNNLTAAVDCYQRNSDNSYNNIWYLINMLSPELIPQIMEFGWPLAVKDIKTRKTVKYWSSVFLGPLSNWGQDDAKEKLDLIIKQGGKKAEEAIKMMGNEEIIFLFSVTPYEDIFPNDQGLSSVINVYGIDFDSGEPGFPFGQVKFEMSINGQTFGSDNLFLNDITSTTNGVFLLTNNQVIAFQYGFAMGNDRIGNIKTLPVNYPTYKFAIVQQGYRFSAAIVSIDRIYEYDWKIPEPPMLRGSYEGPTNVQAKDVTDCQINFAYVMVRIGRQAFFLQRNQYEFSNTAYVINYAIAPMSITRLQYNDVVLSVTPKYTDVISLSPAFLKISANNGGSQTFQLSATSQDVNSNVVCTTTISMQALQPGDTNVYQTNLNVQTVFDGFPQQGYSFPINGPFAGSNVEYILQSLGKQERFENKKESSNTDKKWYKEIKNTIANKKAAAKKTFLQISENDLTESQANQMEPAQLQATLENLQQNSSTFSLTNPGPAVGEWPVFINGQNLTWTYSWYDNLNPEYFWTFNQAQVKLGYIIYIDVCEIINRDPNNFNCTTFGQAQTNGAITAGAAGNFFGSKLLTVAYQTSTQGFVQVFNFTGDLFHQYNIAAGPENLVTDVDIIGSYVFLSQPILKSVGVYWFNPNNYFPNLYNLTESTIGNWAALANGAWEPLAVWGHNQLPNLVYVEMLDSIVSIALSFSNPIYVNQFPLSSVLPNPNFSRTISVTPFALVVAEANNQTNVFTITEYLTVNPYQLLVSKSINNFYGWTPRFPLVASASISSNNLYIVATNAQNEVGVLVFKSLVPQISTLYYVGILNATLTDSISISSCSFIDDYVLVVDTKAGTVQPFFIPVAPYVTVVPPVFEDYSLFTEAFPFTVQVNSLNQQQSPLLFKAKLSVVNPQSYVSVGNANADLTFNSEQGAVQTLWVDDSEWVTMGSMSNYTIVGGPGQQYTNVINHLNIGASDLYGLGGVTSLAALNDGLNFMALTASAEIYTLNSSFSISMKPISLGVDSSEYNCVQILPVYSSFDSTTLQFTLSFCQQISSGIWFAIPVSYASFDPTALAPFALTGLTYLNPNQIVWFEGYLYVLDGPDHPSKAKYGQVFVYGFDFSSPGTASFMAAFGAGKNNITVDFNVASFYVAKTDLSTLGQLVLLDGFGRGVFYATFDSTFSSIVDLIQSSVVWDIYAALHYEPVNAYLPITTRYLSILPLGTPTVTGSSIVYSLLLVTDVTPVYEFSVAFSIVPNSNKRPLEGEPTLTRVYGTLNGRHRLVPNVQTGNGALFVPYHDDFSKQSIILSYNMQYFPLNWNNTFPILTPVLSSVSFEGINTANNSYTIFTNPDTNNGSPQLIFAPNNNRIWQITYNTQLGLQFSQTAFNTTELQLQPNGLNANNQLLGQISVSIQNTAPAPSPSPSPQPSPTSDTGGNGGGLTWLWVLLGIVGGIGLIAIIVWFFRRGKLAEEHQPLSAPLEGEDSIKN